MHIRIYLSIRNFKKIIIYLYKIKLNIYNIFVDIIKSVSRETILIINSFKPLYINGYNVNNIKTQKLNSLYNMNVV